MAAGSCVTPEGVSETARCPARSRPSARSSLRAGSLARHVWTSWSPLSTLCGLPPMPLAAGAVACGLRGGDDARHCQGFTNVPSHPPPPRLARLPRRRRNPSSTAGPHPARTNLRPMSTPRASGPWRPRGRADPARRPWQRTLTSAVRASRAAKAMVPHAISWPRHWKVWSSSGASMPCSLTSSRPRRWCRRR